MRFAIPLDLQMAPRLRRTLVAGLVAAALSAVDGAAETAHAAASPPTGGARAGVIPEVRDVDCARNCDGHGAVRSSSRAVRAHAGTVLRIRGRRLQTVQKVVFVGRPGATDDVLVNPRRTSRDSVVVDVPRTASSGRLMVTTRDGSSSKPGPKVQIHRHAPPPPPPSPQGPASESLIWPVRGQITGKFGEDRGSHYHSGLDIAAPGGTPIKAAAAGTVTHEGLYGGYGNYTCVAHVTITTCYAHQSKFAAGLGKGAKVAKGQVIGYVGNTGNSSGDHLHFEVRNGPLMSSTTVDPTRYLP
jgi:murein DD-endopeptidase MepM/ murein hydrolase activator NlpD